LDPQNHSLDPEKLLWSLRISFWKLKMQLWTSKEKTFQTEMEEMWGFGHCRGGLEL